MPKLQFGRFRFGWLTLVGLGMALSAAAIVSIGHVKPAFNISLNEPIVNSSQPATVLDPAQYGTGMQRTLRLLQTSTPEHRNTVRILFYGQSIIKQNWWLDIADDFRQRFPNADIVIDNRSIGGFDSPKLVHTAEHDLYPFYPDLMIFHVFGGHRDYETIIANTRRRTTAEVALISDHVVWRPTGTSADKADDLKNYQWHNDHSINWLPAIAKKYGCELIEIRRPWERYLQDQHLTAQELLMDEIHLNARGNALMAELVKTHLRHLPTLTGASDVAVKQYAIDRDVKVKDGKLTLEFEGNRVDLVRAPNTTSTNGIAQVLIDGKTPSSLPNLFAISLPSNALGVEWPSILNVTAQKPLIAEDWKLVITEVDPEVKKIKFDAFGSITGFDGSGESDQKFVSNSGRVVIEPHNWWLQNAYQNFGKPVPVGFQIKWSVKPLFNDVYATPVTVKSSHEYATLIAQNLSNTKHTLEIIPEVPDQRLFDEIRVYRPPVQ